MAIIKPNNNTISAITSLPAAITTGKILQIAYHTDADDITTTSTSYVDTGFSGAIENVVSGNKVLCLGVLNAVGPNATYTGVQVGFFRGDTEVQTISLYNGYNTSSTNHQNGIPFTFLDTSPGSGTVTYKFQFKKSGSGSGTARVMVDDATSSLTLIEVQS
nr:uncharacterized protein [uncultured Mediterranean phage uvMED]